MKSPKTLPFSVPVFSLLIVVVSMLGLTVNSFACDACNLVFQEEVLDKRADTPGGRDMLAAMKNQRNLPLTSPVHMVSTERLDTHLAALSASETSTEPTQAQPRNTANAAERRQVDFSGADFIEIIERDEALPIPATSFVPQDTVPDKSFTIHLHEGTTYLGNGVVFEGFLTDGSVPGPTIIVDEGDVVEFNVVNNGSIPHGASLHAAYTQTSAYLGRINPGQTGRVVFRANTPGVYMYHCAPGGHAIPMHVLFGQYGMMVVRPKQEQYQMEKLLGHEPDLELYLIQHEWYSSGKDAIEGNARYVTFNGKIFRYVEEPITARPGDYVRIYFLNIGPNLLSTFHIVGIVWDYVYWQGHPGAVMPGGQSVTAGPTDSWVIEFRIPPEEGAYTMLSHAVGSTSRGAIGLIVADREAEMPKTILADGPVYSESEMESYIAEAVRKISPFKPGTPDVDGPVRFGPETKDVQVSIIGNSYHPKVIEVAPGTTVTWINEDVFTYMAGEFSGVHNAAAVSGPESFVTPLLAHAESASFTFEVEGVYDYICTPHPYMEGRVIVSQPELQASAISAADIWWLLPLIALALGLAVFGVARKSYNSTSQ